MYRDTRNMDINFMSHLYKLFLTTSVNIFKTCFYLWVKEEIPNNRAGHTRQLLSSFKFPQILVFKLYFDIEEEIISYFSVSKKHFNKCRIAALSVSICRKPINDKYLISTIIFKT